MERITEYAFEGHAILLIEDESDHFFIVPRYRKRQDGFKRQSQALAHAIDYVQTRKESAS